MTDLTRRGFVKGSVGAAAGAATLGALLAASEAAEATPDGEPLVAYVRDAKKGDISLLAADREIRVRDPKLAAQIARAAR